MRESPARESPPNLTITDAEFRKFGDYFRSKSGVLFSENKRYFVDSRIAERAFANKCGTFKDYFALLRLDASGREIQELINLLTVNETYFFRENYQLESLVQFGLPEIAKRKRAGDLIRIWSLPCSTGEEPYSIAIALLDGWAQSDRYQIEIVGSDIDTRVLAAASAGIYGERSLQNVGPDIRARYFRRHATNEHQIIPELRSSVDLSRINLSDKADMSRHGKFDIVFCRNLLIYFDDDSRREAVQSIFERLTHGGFLYLGHSETLNRLPTLFESRHLGDCIVYQRPLQDS